MLKFVEAIANLSTAEVDRKIREIEIGILLDLKICWNFEKEIFFFLFLLKTNENKTATKVLYVKKASRGWGEDLIGNNLKFPKKIFS